MSDETWLDSLPTELRDAPFLAKAESAKDAMEKLAHAAKLVGTSIRIPDTDAPAADREAFFTKLTEVDGVARLPTHDDEDGWQEIMGKLGRPNEYTDYKLPDVADFEWDETVGTDLRKYALEASLTDRQFDALAKQIAAQEQASKETAAQATEDLRKSLRTDWGDTLEPREELIRGWMQQSNAPEDLVTAMNDRSLPVETMNWLHEIAKQFKGEVTPIRQDGSSDDPVMTPDDARSQVQKLLGDITGLGPDDPRKPGLTKKLVAAQRLASG